jgi:hypothetical protein
MLGGFKVSCLLIVNMVQLIHGNAMRGEYSRILGPGGSLRVVPKIPNMHDSKGIPLRKEIFYIFSYKRCMEGILPGGKAKFLARA